MTCVAVRCIKTFSMSIVRIVRVSCVAFVQQLARCAMPKRLIMRLSKLMQSNRLRENTKGINAPLMVAKYLAAFCLKNFAVVREWGREPSEGRTRKAWHGHRRKSLARIREKSLARHRRKREKRVGTGSSSTHPAHSRHAFLIKQSVLCLLRRFTIALSVTSSARI